MFDGFGFGGGVWFALAHLVCFLFCVMYGYIDVRGTVISRGLNRMSTV